MSHIKFCWLGPQIIECNNHTVQIETRKATALLAYLSLTTIPPSRDKLATLFWPESDQSHAQANLRRALYSLNQTLGYGILLRTNQNIGMNPDSLVWQDVSEFSLLLETVKSHQHKDIAVCVDCINNLEKAVSLYQGDFLEGLNLQECPEFDKWQYLQREFFHQEFAFCLENLASAYTSFGQWGKVIKIAHHWVSLDQLDEKAQRMLIQAYAQAGYRSAALHQFEECSHYIQVEIGQSPEKETIALYQDIRSGKIGKQAYPTEELSHQPLINPPTQPLIKTKLFIPHQRTGLVSRLNLLKKVNQGTKSKLTLISAPAGYGKTTLLSGWIDNLQKSEHSSLWAFCWLSLDSGDNDPTRFLSYLTAALMKVIPELSTETQSILKSSQSIHSITPMSILINYLEELPKSILLVLDDYQFISNPAIHEGIAFLLEHLPVNVHVVISTRSDPPIPLARFRSRNQLTEIRVNDLRFTTLETTELLNNVVGLSLTPDQVTILENRTEGWIAGLQMAAISLQDRLGVVEFIEKFSGSHRYIMDYLTEEALNNQSIEVQEFLLQTSILDQLCEPLCDYVLAINPPTQPGDQQSGVDFIFIENEEQSRLINLELSNIFIIPLDDDRVWYRYHHLFADLLQTRLNQVSPELVPILHIRASTWYENNGWVEKSIKHALAAKDWDNSTRLIVKHIPTFLEEGQMATILEWINTIPQDEIFRNPMLCEQVAEVYSQAGLIDHIDPYLDKAEELISSNEVHENDTIFTQENPFSSTDSVMIRSMALILRGLKAICSNNPSKAIFFTQKALEDYPQMGLKELAVLFWVKGWANRNLGRLNDALKIFTKANNCAQEAGVFLRDIWTDLAFTNRLVGNLNQAIETLTTALEIASTVGMNEQGNLSRGESFLSFIFLEQNKLELAFKYANQAISHTRWWPSHNIIATAYTSLAQILLTRNDLDGSLLAIEKADFERKNRLMTPFVHSLVEVTQVQIWLVGHEWDFLNKWSSDLISTFPSRRDENFQIDECLELRMIMLVRVLMQKTELNPKVNEYNNCLSFLTLLENNSRNIGRLNSLVEILLLKATVLFSLGKVTESMGYLEKCLLIAEPGGYKRIFLNTGKPVYNLLSSYLQGANLQYRSYVKKIIDEFGENNNSKFPIEGSPETITLREMEVLNLLALGFSNRKIAEELILSEGTIKFHMHNILRKLQVNNRTQAIVKSKKLGLLQE